MRGVELTDDQVVDLEAGLISMGSHTTLPICGNLVTEKMARTSHSQIFAIGDLKIGLNQVVVQ